MPLILKEFKANSPHGQQDKRHTEQQTKKQCGLERLRIPDIQYFKSIGFDITQFQVQALGDYPCDSG